MKDPYDFENYLVRMIREHDPKEYGLEYHDICLHKVFPLFMKDIGPLIHTEVNPNQLLQDAAWALCLRGVLRPGASVLGSFRTGPDAVGGQVFSITRWGRRWIEEHRVEEYIPCEPTSLIALFDGFEDLLGKTFSIRANEAVRCLFAHAHFACCAMCGAAVESVLVRILEQEEGRVKAEADIRSFGARNKLIKRLEARIPDESGKRKFFGLTEPVHYWRDVSAHGLADDVDSDTAFIAIGLLARFARFMSSNWNLLLKPETKPSR